MLHPFWQHPISADEHDRIAAISIQRRQAEEDEADELERERAALDEVDRELERK